MSLQALLSAGVIRPLWRERRGLVDQSLFRAELACLLFCFGSRSSSICLLVLKEIDFTTRNMLYFSRGLKQIDDFVEEFMNPGAQLPPLKPSFT